MWGEDSSVNFYDQFAHKLSVLIKGTSNIDEKKFASDTAEETFEKILGGVGGLDFGR